MRSRLVVVLAVLVGLAAFSSSSAASVSLPPRAYTGGFSFGGDPESAVIQGLVKTHGTPARFRLEWGRTRAYGHQAYTEEDPYAYNGKQPVPVEGLTGHLRPGTTYHYRLVAWNEAGESIGRDRTLHTPPH